MLSEDHHFVLQADPRVTLVDDLQLVFKLFIGFLLGGNGCVVVGKLRLFLMVLALELVNSVLTHD